MDGPNVHTNGYADRFIRVTAPDGEECLAQIRRRIHLTAHVGQAAATSCGSITPLVGPAPWSADPGACTLSSTPEIDRAETPVPDEYLLPSTTRIPFNRR